MRLYSFQNFYFAGIHAGIQTAHSVAEIATKYQNAKTDKDKVAAHNFHLWAQDHKTIIVKNGGMAGDLRNLIQFLQREDNCYPWAQFNESEYAADGCLTNVSIVVPTRIWEMADLLRRNGGYVVSIPGHGTFAEWDPSTAQYTDLTSTAGLDDKTGVVKFGMAAGYVHSVHYYSPAEVYENEFAKTGKLQAREGKELVPFSEFDVELIKRMNKCGLM